MGRSYQGVPDRAGSRGAPPPSSPRLSGIEPIFCFIGASSFKFWRSPQPSRHVWVEERAPLSLQSCLRRGTHSVCVAHTRVPSSRSTAGE